MPTAHETVLEIDLNALEHNYRYFRSRLEKGVKFMGVVKAFGYGSDTVAVAQKLVSLGADYLAVAYTSEGLALRKAGIKTPILVFHPQPPNFQELLDYCLEPSLYSYLVLQKFIDFAQEKNQEDYPVHLKFNTGLNRLGFSEEEAEKVGDQLKKNSVVKVVSMFSHLAASGDWREREFTLFQIHGFQHIALKMFQLLGYKPLLHICNTSGIINYPKAHLDMVRVGIGLYGFGNDELEDGKLRPIGTLKTVISQIQDLEKGETVGYDRAFVAIEPTRIAVLPIGYGDGIGREFGNERAGVFVNGKYAPIIGNVCMDMLMINITGINCEEGDEVIIFGETPQQANKLAEVGNTISYEVITRISQRVKRLILE